LGGAGREGDLPSLADAAKEEGPPEGKEQDRGAEQTTENQGQIRNYRRERQNPPKEQGKSSRERKEKKNLMRGKEEGK